MGNIMDKKTKPASPARRIVMVGLDNAGKSTVLSYLKNKLSSVEPPLPTIGFNVERIETENGLVMMVWDIGGQTKVRKLWMDYCKEMEGLLFVVDSSDRERIWEARHELHRLMEDKTKGQIPCIVLANKQDMRDALTPEEVAAGLHLNEMDGLFKCHVQPTCALTGEGVKEAISMLAKYIKRS